MLFGLKYNGNMKKFRKLLFAAVILAGLIVGADKGVKATIEHITYDLDGALGP